MVTVVCCVLRYGGGVNMRNLHLDLCLNINIVFLGLDIPSYDTYIIKKYKYLYLCIFFSTTYRTVL
jgi:hypothetical protein